MSVQAKATPEELVQQLFSRISEVSTLPTVALQIIEVANNPSSGAADLLDAVEYDAALATRIVRTVNSSYYSLQNKVADLKLAITLLGFKEIRNLAMTANVAQLFKADADCGNYSRQALWTHLVATGTTARLIAERCRKAVPREAYLAGLLHDLGLILIDQYLNKPFLQVLDVLAEDTPLCGVEEEILGFNHMQLGEYVASQWRLPDHLIAAIRYHHAPQSYTGEYRGMVDIVSLANFLCHAKGFSSMGVRNAEVPPAEVFARLGLEEQHVAAIWEQLDDALATIDVMSLGRLRGD
ncbi:MAG: HDOD domain-containing protein [Planctomycetes bacterium]|nr:HDOD domain-containing protein [Planctomycetota bacterium]